MVPDGFIDGFLDVASNRLNALASVHRLVDGDSSDALDSFRDIADIFRCNVSRVGLLLVCIAVPDYPDVPAAIFGRTAAISR